MAVAKGQTFRAEPLSKMTDEAQWPEQPIEMYRGRVWSRPSGDKSSSENTMQVALLAIIM